MAFFRRVERVFREVIEEEERRVEQARVKSEGRDVAFGDLGFWTEAGGGRVEEEEPLLLVGTTGEPEFSSPLVTLSTQPLALPEPIFTVS